MHQDGHYTSVCVRPVLWVYVSPPRAPMPLKAIPGYLPSPLGQKQCGDGSGVLLFNHSLLPLAVRPWANFLSCPL